MENKSGLEGSATSAHNMKNASTPLPRSFRINEIRRAGGQNLWVQRTYRENPETKRR